MSIPLPYDHTLDPPTEPRWPRLSGYLECDECGRTLDGGTAEDALRWGERDGWYVRDDETPDDDGRIEALCPGCMRDEAIEDDYSEEGE